MFIDDFDYECIKRLVQRETGVEILPEKQFRKQQKEQIRKTGGDGSKKVV
jgi:hypothetical protein